MVSLIVGTVDRVMEVDRLLTSLDGQIYKEFEVVVVDQNQDERLAPLFEGHPGLAIKHLRSQPGISRARNIGLAAAKGEIVAIPDDDCWYPQRLLGEVTTWFASHPEFGILNVVKRSAENKLVGPKWPATARNCTRVDVWNCAISSQFSCGVRFVTRSATLTRKSVLVPLPTINLAKRRTTFCAPSSTGFKCGTNHRSQCTTLRFIRLSGSEKSLIGLPWVPATF